MSSPLARTYATGLADGPPAAIPRARSGQVKEVEETRQDLACACSAKDNIKISNQALAKRQMRFLKPSTSRSLKRIGLHQFTAALAVAVRAKQIEIASPWTPLL